jgi:hypothetical protein
MAALLIALPIASRSLSASAGAVWKLQGHTQECFSPSASSAHSWYHRCSSEGRGNMANIERESLTPKNKDSAISKTLINDEAEPDSDNFTTPKRANQAVNKTSGCYVAKARPS